MYRMEKFSDFIVEQKDVPYELLIISHDGIDDVNETGPLIHKTAKKNGNQILFSRNYGDSVWKSLPTLSQKQNSILISK